METVFDRHFEGEHVEIDEKHFIGCTLCRCTLEYAGGAVILERTRITGCRYVFCGPAQCTVNYLKTMGLLPATFTGQSLPFAPVQ